MRIRKISVRHVDPVRFFDIDELSDLVVIAGPNGVGKTRLVSHLLGCFSNIGSHHQQNSDFVIEATDNSENEIWGTSSLTTQNLEDAQKLQMLLQQTRRRRNFKSSIIYYESNRTIQKINPLNFQFDFPDPWEEDVSWDLSISGLASRWEDTQHAIFKKIQNQKNSIANRAIQLKKQGHGSMNLDFSDPLIPFRDAFSSLLGPKSLHTADIQNQRLLYMENGEERNITTLSSGEREVLNIAFDFILRKPSHCIIFFDEPELHLHPELLSRLITTLRSAGESNQFFLISHSPDLISSSLDDTVVFLTPARDDDSNQAVKLDLTSDVTEALHRLGQSIGIISLGKKIVLIEGTESSLDKKTYSHILKNRFPELVLLPSGGKGNLSSFHKVSSEVLEQTLWGINFFMLADRDSAPTVESGQNTNFRTLSRYHLENYFLDSEILALCFSETEDEDSWLRSAEKIETRLREIAKDCLGYAVSLVVSKQLRYLIGNIDVMPKGVHNMDASTLVEAFVTKSATETERVNSGLHQEEIQKIVKSTYEKFDKLLNIPENTWKNDFPGKPIFARFCSETDMQQGRMKNLYLSKAEHASKDPFEEIFSIFSSFASM